MVETVLSLHSRTLNSHPFDLSKSQKEAQALVSGFLDQVTDGYSLAAMVGGGLVYRLGRLGTMALGSRVLGHVTAMPLRALSIGVGFTGEVFTFEAGQRALRVGIGGADPKLLHWSGENGLKNGLMGAAITLGPLKGAGVFTQGQNPILRHLFQDGSMVLAHNVSGALGITDRPRGSIAQQMVHAEATLWQMNAGMALVQGAFPILGQAERSLDLSIRSQISPSPQPSPTRGEGAQNGIPSPWMGEGQGEGGPGYFMEPLLATAGGPAFKPDGSDIKKAEGEKLISKMSSIGDGNDGSGKELRLRNVDHALNEGCTVSGRLSGAEFPVIRIETGKGASEILGELPHEWLGISKEMASLLDRWLLKWNKFSARKEQGQVVFTAKDSEGVQKIGRGPTFDEAVKDAFLEKSMPGATSSVAIAVISPGGRGRDPSPPENIMAMSSMDPQEKGPAPSGSESNGDKDPSPPHESLVPLPKTRFVMGSESKEAFADEQPVRVVELKGYYLRRTHTTWAEYAEYVGEQASKPFAIIARNKQTGRMEVLRRGTETGLKNLFQRIKEFEEREEGTYDGHELARVVKADFSIPAGQEKHPIIKVTWYEALGFADWWGRKYAGKPGHLPTEAQSENGLRGPMVDITTQMREEGLDPQTVDSAQFAAWAMGEEVKGRYEEGRFGRYENFVLWPEPGQLLEFSADIFKNPSSRAFQILRQSGQRIGGFRVFPTERGDFNDTAIHSSVMTNKKGTRPVDEGILNPNGLMIGGNAWEWGNDWHQDSYAGLGAENPSGPVTGEFRVLRGGSFLDGDLPGYLRAARRNNDPPAAWWGFGGFRVALSQD